LSYKLRAFFSSVCILFTAALIVTPVHAQQPLQSLHHHVRQAVTSGQAALVKALPATQPLNVIIQLELRNQDELTNFLQQLNDPSSPNFRNYLSVDQFTAQFAPSVEDYQAIIDFVERHGLTVLDTPANRLILPVSGTTAQIENAFNVKMNLYQHPTEDRTFYSIDREPSIALTVPVAHIAGLDNYSIPHPLYKLSSAGSRSPRSNAGSGPFGLYLGSDRRTAYYGGTALNGTGQSVGLFELDGYDQSDLQSYFTNVGQTLGVPVNPVTLLGANADSDGDDTEQVIDIVDAASMAPGLSQILVYIAPDSSFSAGTGDVAIFNRMATDNVAKQISVSWGWIPADPSSDDPIFEELAAQGQSVFVATGDNDAWTAGSYVYPAEDPYVTAVGGTTWQLKSGVWASETAWGDQNTSCSAGTGSGGGISPDNIAIPNFQLFPGVITWSNAGSASFRNAPDVAAEANCDNYYCANGSCSTGSGYALGGTSLAAPTWAGYTALLNQQTVAAKQPTVGFLNPLIYQIGIGSTYTTDFHDITIGDNGAFYAGAGYDLVTGWGSPSGANLINALAAPGFTLSNAAQGGLTLQPGASTTTTITVVDRGGFSGSVALSASGLPSDVTASFSPVSTAGTSTLTLTAGNSAPYSISNVVVTGVSGSLQASDAIGLTVRGAGFTLSPSASTQYLNPGSSNTVTISVNPQGGFTGSVNLVASGLPSGVTASFSPVSTTGVSILTLTASSNATLGTGNVIVTGTSGNITAATGFSLNVVKQALVLTSSRSSINVGPSTTSTLYLIVTPMGGFSGTVNLTVSGAPAGIRFAIDDPTPTVTYPNRFETVVIATQIPYPPVTPGNYTLTVTAASGSLSSSTTINLTVMAPTKTTLSIEPGGGNLIFGTPYTLTATVTPDSGIVTPTGIVNFNIGNTVVPEPLNPAGIATYSSTAPAPGELAFNATYEGNSTLDSSYADLYENVLPSVDAVAIASGGVGTGVFSADEEYIDGGTASTDNTIGVAGVTNAAPEAIYQSERNGAFHYKLKGLTPGAVYAVRLHFAEFHWTKPGQRVFNVDINDIRVLHDFDIVKIAGANEALVEQFRATANSHGDIDVHFIEGAADEPKVSGIEVVPAVSINAGGATVSNFANDEFFSGGETATTKKHISVFGVAGAAPEAVYQSERNGVFTYTIPNVIAGTPYAVRLHFAESHWRFPGQRMFNVAINGTTVLSNFDIIAAAGAADRAIVEQFTVTANDDDAIAISFTDGTADQPKVSGIEVLPAPTPLSINAGGSATDGFVADEDFIGGHFASTDSTIDVSGVANAATEAIYQSGRDGIFTYIIPNLTVDTLHTVTLHFAEFYWTKPGQRVFNVDINNTRVLHDFDIVKIAGANKALIEQFTATPNSRGEIVISFTPGAADQPRVSGLQVQ
jgi:Pro-kumamolisin, activation domain/Malectin domain